MVNSIQPVQNQKESLLSVLDPSFSPKTRAVILDYQGKSNFESGKNQVAIAQLEENEIKIDVSTENGGLLVLSEIYYKPGWKAFVDDIETAIYQTNHVLRSIVVTSGDHHVIMKYDDQKWKWIRLLSRISFFGTLIAILFLYKNPIIRLIKK